MIRLASVGDAGELERLNAEFNGKGKTTEESIRASFLTIRREIVIVADGDGEYMLVLTDVYVRPEYRCR